MKKREIAAIKQCVVVLVFFLKPPNGVVLIVIGKKHVIICYIRGTVRGRKLRKDAKPLNQGILQKKKKRKSVNLYYYYYW